MKIYKKLSVILLLFLIIYLSCSTNTNPLSEDTGFISVDVIDYTIGPVAGVEIYLLPDSLMKVTDSNGNVLFVVNPGAYFIDADVCCIGPGYIKYHEAATVSKNDTTFIELKACLLCD